MKKAGDKTRFCEPCNTLGWLRRDVADWKKSRGQRKLNDKERVFDSAVTHAASGAHTCVRAAMSEEERKFIEAWAELDAVIANENDSTSDWKRWEAACAALRKSREAKP